MRIPVPRLVRPSILLHLRVGRSSLRAEAGYGAAAKWTGETSYSGPADLAEAIGRLAAEPPWACGRLTVELERPPVQLRTLEGLPPVKRRHLAALVAQQAGRFFRHNGHPLVTDAVWLGSEPTRAARAAAVEQPLVEALEAGARRAGLWLETIRPAGERTLGLLSPSERASRERVARRRTRRLATAASSVWALAAFLFCGRLAWELRAVAHELATLAHPLEAVLAARREVRVAEMTLAAVAGAERGRGRSLAVLAAVTSALPDSSVLTSFVWSEDAVGVLAGGARRAADAVARLDRMVILGGARLQGPITRESVAGRDWERLTVLIGTPRLKAKGGGP